MFEFFRSWFNPAPPSGATAKERLRLVLLSDHLSLAPDVIEAMKRDLLEVLSRYVEIDVANADVTFEHRETEVAMLASVPITGVRDRKPPADVAPPEPVAAAVAKPRTSANGGPRRRKRKKTAGAAAQPTQTTLGAAGIAASQA
jgi:cell division topological specificity factor